MGTTPIVPFGWMMVTSSETWNKYWKDMKSRGKEITDLDPDPMYIADPHEIGYEFEEDGLWEIKGQSMFLPKFF